MEGRKAMDERKKEGNNGKQKTNYFFLTRINAFEFYREIHGVKDEQFSILGASGCFSAIMFIF